MQDSAAAAIRAWPIAAHHITLAAHRENAVFRVESKDGTYALRLHRPAYRSDAELQSELDFMAMLAAGGISVPEPVRSTTGNYVEHVDGQQVSLLRWLSGSPLGETGEPIRVPDRLGLFRRLGATIAQMHDLTERWQKPRGFARKSWDVNGLLGENPQWGRFWENPFLESTDRKILHQARSALRNVLTSRPFTQGLIHADLVCENILVDGDALHVIDFDDCGPGFHAQDLATALVKHTHEVDYPELKLALFEGYAARRSLNASAVDVFLLMRHLSYLGWITPRMTSAGGEARARNFIAQAMPMAEAFLQHPPVDSKTRL